MTNPNFMNGVPELLVLRLLEQQEMYGYELVQAIRARTDDAISLGEGVVYPLLHALEQQGALKSRRKAVNGRTRIYYSVTARGGKHLARLIEQWSRIAGAVTRTITEAPHAAARI
jgi:PadR family transcriptional regulator PadR